MVERDGVKHSAHIEEQHMIGFGALARLLRPVRLHLIGCALLSALGAAAGLAPYIAVAEIARHVLVAASAADAAREVWMWVGIGAVEAQRSGSCSFSCHRDSATMQTPKRCTTSASGSSAIWV